MIEDKVEIRELILGFLFGNSKTIRELETKSPPNVDPKLIRVVVQDMLDDGTLVRDDKLKLQKAWHRDQAVLLRTRIDSNTAKETYKEAMEVLEKLKKNEWEYKVIDEKQFRYYYEDLDLISEMAKEKWEHYSTVNLKEPFAGDFGIRHYFKRKVQ